MLHVHAGTFILVASYLILFKNVIFFDEEIVGYCFFKLQQSHLSSFQFKELSFHYGTRMKLLRFIEKMKEKQLWVETLHFPESDSKGDNKLTKKSLKQRLKSLKIILDLRIR